MYTRNGKFTITREGYLVDCDGNHIQGAGGDIQIPTDAAEIAIKIMVIFMQMVCL